MPGTCAHGFPAEECLICRTLGSTATATVPSRLTPAPAPGSGAHPVAADHPDAVQRSGAPAAEPGRPGRTGLHVLGVLAVLVAIGAVAWILAGVVFALLHILELVLVAAVAGWAGYRVGRFQGRRSRS